MKFRLFLSIGAVTLVAAACTKKAYSPSSPDSELSSAQAGRKTNTPTRTPTPVATATFTKTFTATPIPPTPTPFPPPTCPQILYIGDRSAFYDSVLPNALTCMGYSVTSITSTAYDTLCAQFTSLGGLNQYCQVWDSRFASKTSGAQTDTIAPCEMVAYQNYLAQGGSLYLDGENEAYHSRNDTLVQFLNTVDQIGTVGNVITDCGTDFELQLNSNPSVLAAANNFGSNPVPIVNNTLEIHCTGDFSISAGSTGSGLPVLVNGTGSTLTPLEGYGQSLAYNHAQLMPPYNAGKVFVYMDSVVTSWVNMGNSGCPTTHPLYGLAANIAFFLNP